MLDKVFRVLSALLGISIGYLLSIQILQFFNLSDLQQQGGAGFLGLALGIICFFIFPRITTYFKNVGGWINKRLQTTPVQDILAGIVGLMLGLILATLLIHPFKELPLVGSVLPIVTNIVFGYFGYVVAVSKWDDLLTLFTRSNKDKEKGISNSQICKILDTSVIIDGRVADICHAGFIEGKIIIPMFVLDELQHIADSSDTLKRNRGRRGLDILNRIQKELKIPVSIIEEKEFDSLEVDSRLVKMAQKLKGMVVTNDYNLNKVCELQGVPVLNINELANAVKPVVLPGEEMLVQIVKDGKESGQGVAYLDDGTMIVVEGGRRHIGENLEVLVTSVLQTAAGRMIFAKIKSNDKAC
ncbi:PIN/TRAM domain-containing protein [Alkalicella caledoniensis]|uniref:PIN/TRAM domain-containing protein n=1 Tax=Alkalicella caledoniensis TaxID=2731377 RepID=A0A7G9W803_ALKCA|nr:PIN/TRAM domain-containing protein [Alkalicella caledoniensis]QNO14815.1 PIN/TRAM domain-containing protein [Alkalicella caledoniensis]